MEIQPTKTKQPKNVTKGVRMFSLQEKVRTVYQFSIQQIVCELVPFLNRRDVRSHSSKQAELEYKKKNCPKDTKPGRHSYKKKLPQNMENVNGYQEYFL